MATGDKYLSISENRLLGWQSLKNLFFDYLDQQSRTMAERVYSTGSTFVTGTNLVADGNDKFKLDGYPSDAVSGVDGLGRFLDFRQRTSDVEAIQFENELGADYHVAVRQAALPGGVFVNPVDGMPTWNYYEDIVGLSGTPDSVVDNEDGTITFVVDSVTEAGRSNAGRRVYVFKNTITKNALTEQLSKQLCTVVFSGGNNKITTTLAGAGGAGTFGQVVVSTTASDYTVILVGPMVARDTDLRLDLDNCYLGTVTGAGAGNPPSTFDTTLQNVYDSDLTLLSDITRLEDASGVDRMKVDVKVNPGEAGTNQISVTNGALSPAVRFKVDDQGNVTVEGNLTVQGTTYQHNIEQYNTFEANIDNLNAGNSDTDIHVFKGETSHKHGADVLDFVIDGSTGEVGIGGAVENGFAAKVTGSLKATSGLFATDNAFQLSVIGVQATAAFDANDLLAYDRTNNYFQFFIGGAEKSRLSGTGLGIHAIYVGNPAGTLVDDSIVADKDITALGGLRVGFAGVPTADRIELGDANLFMQWASVVSYLQFDSLDQFGYDRTNNFFHFWIGGGERVRINDVGMGIHGLYVGNPAGSVVDDSIIVDKDITALGGLRVGFSGTPTADRIELGDTTMYLQYSATPHLQFDTGDQFGYDRAANRFWFVVGTAEEMRVRADGIAIADGVFVGNIAGTPVSGQLNVGDANFYAMLSSSDPHINFDSLDYLYYSRTGNTLNLYIGGNRIAAWNPSLCEVGSTFEITGGTSKLILPNSSGGSVAVGTFWRTTYGGNLASGNGTYRMVYPGMLGADGGYGRSSVGTFNTIPVVQSTVGTHSHIRGRATFMFGSGVTGTVGFKLAGTTIAYVTQSTGSTQCFVEFDIHVPSNPGTQTLTGIGHGKAGDGGENWTDISLSVDTSSTFNITCEVLGVSGGTIDLRAMCVEVTSGT